ncbi:MAG TPA: hypothetical protein VF739_09560 [Ktedonobacterales bacterium]
MPMWGYSTGYGFGGMVWSALPLLVCLATFGLLIWALLSVAERHERRADHLAPSALETLQRRYALGEIDEPTFLRMRERLGVYTPSSADNATPETPEGVGASAR